MLRPIRPIIFSFTHFFNMAFTPDSCDRIGMQTAGSAQLPWSDGLIIRLDEGNCGISNRMVLEEQFLKSLKTRHSIALKHLQESKIQRIVWTEIYSIKNRGYSPQEIYACHLRLCCHKALITSVLNINSLVQKIKVHLPGNNFFLNVRR